MKLGKVSELGVWIPHNLSERNTENRMLIVISLLSWVKIELFRNRIITGDEKLLSYDNIVRKSQWSDKDHVHYHIRKQTSMAKIFCCPNQSHFTRPELINCLKYGKGSFINNSGESILN